LRVTSEPGAKIGMPARERSGPDAAEMVPATDTNAATPAAVKAVRHAILLVMRCLPRKMLAVKYIKLEK